jgi:hypothetical protein
MASGTDFGARRVFAVHADLDTGLWGGVTLDVIDAHHRCLAICLALGTCHLAGVAADATLGIHEELFFLFELEEHGQLGSEVKLGD